MTEATHELFSPRYQKIRGLIFKWASQMVLVVKNLPARTGDLRDMGLIPGLGRSPRGGHVNTLQYSGLENPTGNPRLLAGYSPWRHKGSDTTEAT